ncbi:corrinoid protein-associated methyltransferase CpaM [candidate division CSSED10-310 bacterium]|uniref:Corrinoid protein-associated methyltransferase CpaM n=1 Tax=candidate division CSSED10-310 bacterium TaxID=2855610 RepID=A0ABV6YT34_UNCC1
MLSYIYMKILESQPERYDRGITWLSFGHSIIMKRRIAEQIKPGSRVLEIGIGTATLALLMAQQGADILGFDVSAPMLAVARKKIVAAGMADKIQLREMGVTGMDKLPAGSFDMIVSTLVFSELSKDEQLYALRQAQRVLKENGILVIADETRPKRRFKRFLYSLIRLPLLLFTFILTQTTTKAVEGLEEQVREVGFRITQCQLSNWDSFIYLVARKESVTP